MSCATVGDVLKSVPISEVSFVSMDGVDKKMISFFSHDKSLRIIACNTFRIMKDSVQFPVAVNRAFKILRGEEEVPSAGKQLIRRRTSKAAALRESRAMSSKHTAETDNGRLLAAWPAVYTGFCKVDKLRDVIVRCQYSVTRLLCAGEREERQGCDG